MHSAISAGSARSPLLKLLLVCGSAAVAGAWVRVVTAALGLVGPSPAGVRGAGGGVGCIVSATFSPASDWH